MKYRNARYIDAKCIDCEIYHPQYGWIPYTVNPDDNDNTVDNEKLLASMDKNGDVKPLDPVEYKKRLSEQARYKRNIILELDVDPVVTNPLRWGDLSDDKKSEWADYRKSLLDITEQEGFPETINWPTKPE